MPRKPPEARPIHHPDIGPQLRALVPSAINVIRSALERQKGDKATTDLAKWVLSEAAQDERGKIASMEEAEVSKTLHLLRGGRK